MASANFMSSDAFAALLDLARASASPASASQQLQQPSRQSSMKDKAGIFVLNERFTSTLSTEPRPTNMQPPQQGSQKTEGPESDPVHLSSKDEPESVDEQDLWFNVGAAAPADPDGNRIKREASIAIFTPSRRDSARSSASSAAAASRSPKKFKVSRSQLVFFGHKIGGKVENAKHNETIELPRLRPETFSDFRKVLTDQVQGQNTNFSRIDNLCLAFLGATALEDTKFQRMVVERIRTRVIALAEVDPENLYKKLLGKVAWAWSHNTEGRTGLRPVLAASLAYICTGYETKVKQETKRGRKRKRSEEDSDNEEPVLRMNVVVELTQRLGHLKWFSGEILPSFMGLCTDLVRLNNTRDDGEWEMLGVERLLPNSVPVELN